MRRIALLAVVAAACSEPAGPLTTAALAVTTDAGRVELAVQIADTPEERRTGLMGRTDLAPYDGMAFVWDEPTTARFWMKDTLIPLSVAFWDERGRIVAILDMEPCSASPCPRYQAGTSFVGAVEVERGLFEELGIALGDRVELVPEA